MNTTNRIAVLIASVALVGSAAFAQGTSPQATSTQTAEQREAARLEAEAAKAALAAQQAAQYAVQQAAQQAARQGVSEQDRRKLEEAQQKAEQARKEVAKVQDALKQAQRELELYAKGTAALDQARYEKALQAFAEAAALKGAKADGALYWKAFSEYKAAELQAALASLHDMQKDFPDSRWLEQARALEFEVQAASGKPLSPAATPDEEIKLLALNSLLHTDSEQALPMLEKMINGQQPLRLKKRALFVVSQSKSPRAKEILTTVAKGSSNPDLQLEAILYLQLFGDPETRNLLEGIYSTSKDTDVKAQVIDALFIQGNAKALVDLARKETDPAARKRIVERLSRMKSKDATDYMLELINK